MKVHQTKSTAGLLLILVATVYPYAFGYVIRNVSFLGREIGNVNSSTRTRSTMGFDKSNWKKVQTRCKSSVTMGMIGDGNEISPLPELNDKIQEEEKKLTPEAIAELVEVTFVNAILQIASGYVDVLKLFIVAVKSAYEMDLEVKITEADGDEKGLIEYLDECPVQSAKRPLMPEEETLRLEWINLIYLTLNILLSKNKYDEPMLSPAFDDRKQEAYGSFCNYVIDAKVSKDVLFSELNLDDILSEDENLLKFVGSDPMKKALMKHAMRLVYMTLVVIDEERRCFEDQGLPPARPYIPGAF